MALLVAFSGSPYIAIISQRIPDISNYLFVFSVGHMVLLVLLGIGTARPYNLVAGSKIQTAGYLHTLVGFSSALFRINPDSFTIISFMIPLGSALTTSIIGWFVGGEIAERDSLTPEKSVRFEMEKVASELDGFATAIRRVHEQYVRTINEASSEYTDLHKKQSKIVKEATDMAAKLNDVLSPISAAASKFESSITKAANEIEKSLGDSFLETISQIAINAKNASLELGNTANAANEITKYLQESRVLINELEKLIDLVTSETDRHET